MHNEIITIGPVTIYGYGLMIAIGIFLAYFLAEYRARRVGLDGEEVFGLTFFAVAAGLIGGKVLYYITTFREILADPSLLLDVADGFVIYGALIGGVAGERFCVRNSGALAVVEGVGDHGCEYMTGGRVVVLGQTGKNFAAGMSGGIAYVLDEDNDLYTKINKEMVYSSEITSKYDVLELKDMIKEHVAYTNSEKGKRILDNFGEYLPRFKKIIPHDYDRMLKMIVQMEEKGLSAEQAQIEAFYINMRK